MKKTRVVIAWFLCFAAIGAHATTLTEAFQDASKTARQAQKTLAARAEQGGQSSRQRTDRWGQPLPTCEDAFRVFHRDYTVLLPEVPTPAAYATLQHCFTDPHNGRPAEQAEVAAMQALEREGRAICVEVVLTGGALVWEQQSVLLKHRSADSNIAPAISPENQGAISRIASLMYPLRAETRQFDGWSALVYVTAGADTEDMRVRQPLVASKFTDLLWAYRMVPIAGREHLIGVHRNEFRTIFGIATEADKRAMQFVDRDSTYGVCVDGAQPMSPFFSELLTARETSRDGVNFDMNLPR